MKRKIKRIIGIIMVSLFGGLLIGAMAWDMGIIKALLIIAISAVFCGLFIGGMLLLTDD